jgi:hypothetical protein
MIEKPLDIKTEDGAIETFICHPERNGPFPAVLGSVLVSIASLPFDFPRGMGSCSTILPDNR